MESKPMPQQEVSGLAEVLAKQPPAGQRTVQVMLDEKRFTMVDVIGAQVLGISGRLEHLTIEPLEELPPNDPNQPRRLLVALLVPDDQAELADAA